MGIVEKLAADRKPYGAPRPIDKGDDVAGFSCGKAALDAFIKERAIKNEGRGSRTYVLLSKFGEDAGKVVAYYTLAAGAVTHEESPAWAKRNMPNPIPVIVLGRLAVHRRHQGRALGKHLMREAMQRTLEASRQIGVRALIVHATDDEAVSFYVPFGFQKFPTDGRTLFMSAETIAKAL